MRNIRMVWALGPRFAGLLGFTMMLVGCAGQSQAGTAVGHLPHVPLTPAIAIIKIGIHSHNDMIRADSIESLEHLHRSIIDKLVAHGLGDPSPMVRFSAAMVAGRRRLAALKSQLRSLMADPNPNVRVAAIYALDRLGDSSQMNNLAGFLHSSQPSVRANTAMVLGRLGDHSAIALLLTQTTDKNHGVQIAVTSALARLGYRRAISSLIALSLSGYEQDHLAALSTCRTLQNSLAINVLRAGLREPDPAANLIAARGLGERGSALGEKIAVKYSESSDPHLRALAALALGSIPVTENYSHLSKLLSDQDTHVRVAAAAAIFNFHAMVTRVQKLRANSGP